MASFLQVENISKSYGDKVLFQNISFNINEGDKIALIAPNGTGKSSLLKILAGLDSSDRGGEVKFMKDIKVAFLDQMSNFNPQNTLYDEVYSRLGSTYEVIRNYEQAIASGDERAIERAMSAMDAADGWSVEQRIKQVLSSLKLTRLDQPMGELSGGEAKRASIALMLLQDADFLIMDEPTNHLDFQSQDVLQRALAEYPGSYCIVSHNRQFLDPIVNKVLEFRPGYAPRLFYGNVSAYLETVEAEEKRLKAASQQQAVAAPAAQVQSANRKDARRAREMARQQRNKVLKPLQLELEQVEADIAAKDERKEVISAELESPANMSDNQKLMELTQEYQQLERESESLYSRWEELSEEIELKTAELEAEFGPLG